MEKRNLKKFITNKKIIKTITLINNEKDIKNVFLNFDMSTFAFGFIPSILRKRYDVGIFILIIQILNFFVVSFPFSILTNFTITFISSIITAKGYLDYLVDEKEFMPYAIWKDMNYEEEYIEKQLISKSEKSEKIIVLSSIFVIISIIILLIFSYKELISEIIPTNNKVVIENNTSTDVNEMIIKNYGIIAIKEEKIESILILNTNSNNDLDGVVYPGNIQIQLNNTVDELNRLVDVSNIEDIKEVFDSNFKFKIEDFVLINKEDDKEQISFYEDVLSKILKVHENDIDNRIANLEEKYSNVNTEKVKHFYNSFKDRNISITELKYDVIMLGDIVEINILEALDLMDMANYEFITIDKSILENNEEIKNINEKYDEYLRIKSEKEKNPAVNNGQTGGSTTPSTNNGQTGGSTTPPTNNGQTGGSATPPTNNGQTGGSTTPPTNNSQTGGSTTPPTNNSQTGGSTTPPTSNDQTGGSTTPPTSNDQTGGSTTPPTNSGQTGGSTTPPTNSGQTGGSTTPPTNNGQDGGSTNT